MHGAMAHSAIKIALQRYFGFVCLFREDLLAIVDYQLEYHAASALTFHPDAAAFSLIVKQHRF